MFDEQQNPLIVAAKSGKRLTFSFLAPAVIWIIFIATVIVNGFATRLLQFPTPDTAITMALQQDIGLVMTFGLIALLLWLWVRFYEGRGFVTFGFSGGRITQKVLLGALVAVLMIGASFATAFIIGAYTIATESTPTSGFAVLPAVLLALVGWIVQGSTEEIAFRGYLLPVMAARTKLWIGVGVSAAIFAALHLFNPSVTFLAIFNIGLYGVFTALYALREGSIWGVCAHHAIWNWLLGNIVGTAVSGGNPSFALLKFVPTDMPELLTGGGFGIEGSIITTLVLTVGIAYLWLSARQIATISS